jgi:enoyl-CoA hydratase
MGIAQRIVDDARDGAVELARELATLAPLSVQGHKRALNLVAGAIDDDARAELAGLEARAFASRDLREGLTAFNEKRPARFEGT